MNSRFFLLAGAAVFLPVAQAFSAAAAAVTSDLVPPARRQATVEVAERLTRPPAPAPLPAELPQPFNPPGFEQPDPDEVKAAVPAGPRTAAGGPGASGPTAAPAQPAGPVGDRETLEVLGGLLKPSGSITLGGRPRLIIGTNRFEVGTKFGVTYNNQDYELELVAIDRTTFTLRYRGEEITRPIRPTR